MRRADNLTTFKGRLSWNLGSSTSWNPQGLSRPVMGLLYNQTAHRWQLKRRMRNACCKTRTTNKNSEYVIDTAIVIQQMLHESSLMFLYTYLACLFLFSPTLYEFRTRRAWHYNSFNIEVIRTLNISKLQSLGMWCTGARHKPKVSKVPFYQNGATSNSDKFNPYPANVENMVSP